MKAIHKLMIVGVVVIFGLTACFGAGIFNPFLGGTDDAVGDQTTETGLIDTTNTAESTSNPDGNPFSFTSSSGTLTNATGQLILVNFANGVVDVVDGVILGLTVFELLGPAAAGGEYAQGAAVTYSAVVTTDTSGNSTARLTLDLDSGTMSNTIEIAMDPALVTANATTKLFNQDGDDTPAEVGEDAAYDYLGVGGTPPVTAVGVARDPRDGINFVGWPPTIPAVSGTDIIWNNIDTNGGGYNSRFTAATLSPGLSVFTFDPSTGAFTAESVTPSYDGAGTLTLTLADAVTAGEIYQIRRDDYNITSSETVYGFTQRAMTDQNDSGNRYVRTDLLPEGTVALLDAATDSGGHDPTVYIDVVFTGVGDIVTSGITTDNVRFVMDESNNGNDLFQVPYDFFVVQDGTDGNNRLRFYFAPSYDPATVDGWDVYVYPSVTDDNLTPADATDDLPVLDVTQTDSGVSVESGVW